MSIDNNEDVIDSRQVNERIEELESEQEAFECPDSCGKGDECSNWLDTDEAAELKVLRKLASDGSDLTSEWDDGAALIRDSYFKSYAQELADDIGAIDSSAGWPMNCIDWDQAARELQYDYSTLQFDSVTYWVRS